MYWSRIRNQYFDAARDVDNSNLDRKSGHGGWSADAIGLDMQTPKKALSLPVAQHTTRICLDITYICATISPVKAEATNLLQLF